MVLIASVPDLCILLTPMSKIHGFKGYDVDGFLVVHFCVVLNFVYIVVAIFDLMHDFESVFHLP